MFVIRRTGSFYALPKGCTHCGVDHRQRRFNYEYAICSYPDGLDQSGFVVDNQAPQIWFDELGEFSESCELLALRAAQVFAAWCKHPHSVMVRITGFQTATVEYTFYCDKAGNTKTMVAGEGEDI